MMTWTSMLIAGIRGYQRFVSALLPPACRFYPSCSEYAVQAIATYGPLRGLLKAGWRLLRCHPLSRGGVDLPTVTPGGSWSSHSRPGASRPGASRPSHSRPSHSG